MSWMMIVGYIKHLFILPRPWLRELISEDVLSHNIRPSQNMMTLVDFNSNSFINYYQRLFVEEEESV